MTERIIDITIKFQAIKYIKEAVSQCRSITGTTKLTFTLFIEDDQVHYWVRDFFKSKGFKDRDNLDSTTSSTRLDMEVEINELTPYVTDELAFGSFQKEISKWFHEADNDRQDNYAVINGVKYNLVPVEES